MYFTASFFLYFYSNYFYKIIIEKQPLDSIRTNAISYLILYLNSVAVEKFKSDTCAESLLRLILYSASVIYASVAICMITTGCNQNAACYFKGIFYSPKVYMNRGESR